MNIKFEHVSKVIKHATVIDDVTLTLYGGQIYGLLGYNGSGKTMFLRLIAGLIFPTSGKILINGQLLGKDIAFPPSLGLLIESPAFLDAYSGVQNLALLANIKKTIGAEKISNTLEKVGLNPSSPQKYKKYSLGMKQRLGIAAAVMEAPEILLLDEPTNALDTDGINAVAELILAEQARGTLVVVASHEKEFLHRISAKILLVEHGKVFSDSEFEVVP